MAGKFVHAVNCFPQMKRPPAILLLCLSTIISAQNPSQHSLDGIAKTGRFAFGGVGFAGKTSDGELEFRKIISEPRSEALSDFGKLFEIGNPEAKSYALAGFRKLDPIRFDEASGQLHSSNVKVIIMSGCIISEETLAKVASDIHAGRYDAWIDRAISASRK